MIEIPMWFILIFVISFSLLCIQMIVIYILITSRQQDIILKQVKLMEKMILTNKNAVVLSKNNIFDGENIDNKYEERKIEDFSEITLDEASLILSDKFGNDRLNKNFDSVGLKNEHENEGNFDIVDKLKGIKNVDNN